MKKLFIILFFVILSTYFILPHEITAQQLPKTPPVLKLSDPLPANLFVELGKAVNPAVVNISTSVIPQGGRQYRDPMLEMLEQFYGSQGGFDSGLPKNNGKPRRMGLGTGFIIREDGLIVTNAHVIQGADLIEVQLTENSEKQYKAEIIGQDERTDIALIKIKPDTKLTVATLGSSDETQVGEWVAAFGNPFGHGHSMSKGIISSKGREIEEINRLPMLQTDASINPGNSGGPLVNSKGLVIGVNSAIDARAQGIGFAIPIDEVKKIIPQLEKRGSIRKGYMGVQLGDIDPRSAAEMGLEDYPGAVVMGVGDENGSTPAQQAGLKRYDLILEFNGKKIKSSRDLSDMVAGSEPGTKVKLKILRGESNKNLTMTIGERPDEKKLNSFKAESSSKGFNLFGKKAPHNLGIEVADPTSKILQKFNLESDIKNPVITKVEPGSIASRVGLKAGDVLLSVNKSEPKTASEALNLFKKGENSVRLVRGRGLSVITFDIP